MIQYLLNTEEILADLLTRHELHSMCIDYHPPTVKRIWFQVGDLRIYLHKIYPCDKSADALYHPHPWQSAIRIIEGKYEMGIGHSATKRPPLVTDCKLVLPSGSMYEMLDQDSWHWVNPIKDPVYTLMVTSKPNKRDIPLEPGKKFEKLTFEDCEDILSTFNFYYDLKLSDAWITERAKKLSE